MFGCGNPARSDAGSRIYRQAAQRNLKPPARPCDCGPCRAEDRGGSSENLSCGTGRAAAGVKWLKAVVRACLVQLPGKSFGLTWTWGGRGPEGCLTTGDNRRHVRRP